MAQKKWGWKRVGKVWKLYLNSFEVAKVREAGKSAEARWALFIKDDSTYTYGRPHLYFNSLSMAKEWTGDFILGGFLGPVSGLL